jgi:hypothetical protein
MEKMKKVTYTRVYTCTHKAGIVTIAPRLSSTFSLQKVHRKKTGGETES